MDEHVITVDMSGAWHGVFLFNNSNLTCPKLNTEFYPSIFSFLSFTSGKSITIYSAWKSRSHSWENTFSSILLPIAQQIPRTVPSKSASTHPLPLLTTALSHGLVSLDGDSHSNLLLRSLFPLVLPTPAHSPLCIQDETENRVTAPLPCWTP